ncbi:MAG: hypothetical protein G01um101416_1175 [Microgenomates group bacterium Gr01-1014_16]|nr:MAG: hypothetical protein G01um101416_1175 [Microgenomates group bacterium Gr01-1014_16]
MAIIVYFGAGFWVWRRMRGEYEDEEILKLEMILGLVVVAGWIAFRTWGVVGAGLLVLGWWCRKKEWSFWEWMDVMMPAGLAGGAIVGLNWVWVVGVGMVWLVGRTYRRWKWYRSGRAGLVGLVAVMFVAGGEIAVAKGSGYNLYWGDLELSQWIGIWTVVAAAVAVYLRAGRKVTEDLKMRWQKLQKKA